MSARALLVAIAVAALLAGVPSTALAAGHPAVDQLIVTDALPGWTPISDTSLESLVTSERNSVGSSTTLPFQVGVEGWSFADQSLIAALISFPNGHPPGDYRARDAVVGACGAASHSDPQDMRPYAAITGSTEGKCGGTSAAGVPIDAAVLSWQKDNIFAIVIGNHMTTEDLEKFALTQDEALPSSGPNPERASTDSNSNTGLFVIVGLVAVIGGAILWVAVSRSRHQTPAPIQALSTPVGAGVGSAYGPPAAPSPFATPTAPTFFGGSAQTAAPPSSATGWQPVVGDNTRIAYWDGTTFTAWKRWAGSAWVDSHQPGA